ncbi:hypothetical protein BBJ28_00019838 [Nothophytophthora sp. Chile5]|nr:hypothetical protein BBJ28_00019838 [Nothophytophthora sp. Chile5]
MERAIFSPPAKQVSEPTMSARSIWKEYVASRLPESSRWHSCFSDRSRPVSLFLTSVIRTSGRRGVDVCSKNERRVEIYEALLADETRFAVEMGGEAQQLEVLTLMKHDVMKFGDVLTPRELDVISATFETVSRRSGVVVGVTPAWLTNTKKECGWLEKTSVKKGGEEKCLREAAIWAELYHPYVSKFYGACHVGKVFHLHEWNDSVINKTLTWRLLLGCALGLEYIHERGLVYQRLCEYTLDKPRFGSKWLLNGLGLVRLRQTNVGFGDSRESEAQIPTSSDDDIEPSVSSDVLAFGLAIFEILAYARSCYTTDAAMRSQPKPGGQLPRARPDALKIEEWELLVGMCHSDPAVRTTMIEVVQQMRALAKGEEKHEASTNDSSNAPPELVQDVTLYSAVAATGEFAMLGGEVLPLWFIPLYQVEITKRIADGSFGSAHEGQWLGADVVVKQALTSQTEKEKRDQFRQKVELWLTLNHQNLIQIYGACHEGQPFFVCERTQHGTLVSFAEGKERKMVLYCLWQAALGLEHLHECGIVHGDIKSSKIICDEGPYEHPSVKLADFGLLNVFADRVKEADSQAAHDSFRWKAPECLNGASPTFASDIYSFGMCIIEALSGEFPWGNSIPDEAVKFQVTQEKQLPARPTTFSDAEWELVGRMCCFDPDRRISIGAVAPILYSFC